MHVTFFLTNMGNGLQKNAAGFAAIAKAGHEIGNHTDTHAHLSGTSNAAFKANIYFLTNILFTIRPCTFCRTM